MLDEKQSLSPTKVQEMQEKLQKLDSGVLLSPEEYSALLRLLAQAELARQQARMQRAQ